MPKTSVPKREKTVKHPKPQQFADFSPAQRKWLLDYLTDDGSDREEAEHTIDDREMARHAEGLPWHVTHKQEPECSASISSAL